MYWSYLQQVKLSCTFWVAEARETLRNNFSRYICVYSIFCVILQRIIMLYLSRCAK